MKTSGVVVGLLLLNLAVIAGLLGFMVRDQRPSGKTALIQSVQPVTNLPPAPAPTIVETVVVTNEFKWAQLESEDYHEYIGRLRSIGCPEATIRDIIIADLDKLMAPEIRALYGRRPELHYWNSVEEELANDVDPREVSRRTGEIEKRKRDIVRELVGADLVRERMEQQGEEDFVERRLSFLPAAHRTQVREIIEKYQEAEQKFREQELEDGDPLDAGDRALLRQLARDRDKDLNQILSAGEKAQFELWMSPSANEVRHAMYGMNATEQEFLSAYQVQRAFAEKWGDRDELMLDATARAELSQDREKRDAELRSKLGDERFALYQRGQDEDFHSLSALATRFKLNREKPAEVYGFKKVAQEIKSQVRANPELNEEQKNRALSAINEETAGAVRAALGDRAYRYYLRTGQASWISE